jgi:hypothetical protein
VGEYKKEGTKNAGKIKGMKLAGTIDCVFSGLSIYGRRLWFKSL